MNDYKGPLDSSWKKGSGYGWDDEKKKRTVRLRILVGFIIVVIALGASILLLWRKSPQRENEKIQNELAKFSEDLSLDFPPKIETVRRKNIYDRNLTELAISFKVDSIYVKPLEFDDIEKTGRILAGALNLDEKDVDRKSVV